MARRRFQKADQQKQRAILDAAIGEFSAHGYEGASLNRIILAAGLSKGGFYYYFEDKADLAATVLEEHVQEVLDGIGGLDVPIEDGDFWGALATIVRRSLEHMKKSPKSTDLLARLSLATLRDPVVSAHLAPLIREAGESWVRIWKRGQALGAVRSDLPVELLIAVMANVKQTVAQVLVRPDTPLTNELLERLAIIQTDLFRRVAEPPVSKARAVTKKPARKKERP